MNSLFFVLIVTYAVEYDEFRNTFCAYIYIYIYREREKYISNRPSIKNIKKNVYHILERR